VAPMFAKIIVALNDLPESQHALSTAIDLSRLCNAELVTTSILGNLPAYSSFSIVVDPGAAAEVMDERRRRHKEMHEKATILAQKLGVHSQGSIIDGNDVRAILHFLKEQNADLLVIGLHQHDFYLSRLWNSVYDLAENATCSVLGVH
jgi:nucleotide-binding universal stress UspA family protein